MTAVRTLITGATGKTGRRVVALLREHGHSVREASRSSATPFDWTRPETWPAALADIDTVYIVPPYITDPATAEQIAQFGRTALAAGVTRATLLSVPLINGEPAATVAAEAALRQTGLAVTVVRLRWFNQNFSEDFLAPFVHAGDLRLPAGTGREAFVDADDIAAVVAATLTDPAHAGEEYELTGPRLLSFADVADELTQATGRTITYTPLTREQYISEQIAAGVPEEWAQLSADLYQGIAAGDLEHHHHSRG
ncbi:NmrA family NAD(P)-binding protein [Corynebacterium xerosis]|uniref:NmrA family NAD(P)-binding protein n=1 Tax=Corynebacterium xerosis TaxID=1725 RepID=UPI00387A5C19